MQIVDLVPYGLVALVAIYDYSQRRLMRQRIAQAEKQVRASYLMAASCWAQQWHRMSPEERAEVPEGWRNALDEVALGLSRLGNNVTQEFDPSGLSIEDIGRKIAASRHFIDAMKGAVAGTEGQIDAHRSLRQILRL